MTATRTTLEHIGATPGLATPICGDCADANQVATKAVCTVFDRVLALNANGKPIRCHECLVDTRGGLND